MPTKLEFGEEEDVDILRKYGDQGDFVIYENVGKKLVGDDSGFRIAFVDQGPNPIKKIRILKTETNRGKTFCMEIDQSRWYNSLEQLVDSCRKDPDTGVQQQFDPAQYPGRSLHRTHSMSTPDIRPSTRNTNSLHPKRSSGPIKFVSDRSKSLNSLIDDTNIDRVIYNVPKVKSLISGKEEGTYVIHAGESNTDEQPYNIYCTEQSTKGPNMKVKKLYVHKDQDDGAYYLSIESDSRFESLKELIKHNNYRFKTPLDLEETNYHQINSLRGKPGLTKGEPIKGEYLDMHKSKRG